MARIVFDDNLLTPVGGGPLTANEVSDVIGPGRTARCRKIQITVAFAGDCNAGNAVVEGSHHQDFPGTPETVKSLAAAAGATKSELYDGPYPFLRVKADNAINGGGITAVRAVGI